jgi:hypothetical protein
MAVVVVEPGARDRQSGVARGDECRFLLCRSVVRNLQDIGMEIHPCAQDRLLARRFHVTSQQHSQARRVDHDHQTAVILPRRLILICCEVADRTEYIEFGLTDAGAGTGQGRAQGNSALYRLPP